MNKYKKNACLHYSWAGGRGEEKILEKVKYIGITDGNKYYREISEGGKNTRGGDAILNKMV